MAMGGKIYTGMDAFNEGMNTSQNMFNSIANRKYQQDKIGIDQQNAQRAQTILPYLLQQYKDAHGKTPLEMDFLKAQIQQAAAKARESQSNVNFNEMFNNAVNGTPPSSQGMPTVSAPTQEPSNMVPPVPASGQPQDTTGMSRHDLVSMANANNPSGALNQNTPMAINPKGNADFDPNAEIPYATNRVESPNASTKLPNSLVSPSQPTINPSQIAPVNVPGQQGEPGGSPAQIPQASVDPLTKPWDGKPGEVVVREKGNPNAYAFDKMAGGTIAGRHYEPIKRETVDGIETVTYPISGKVTVQKVGPSEQEKSDIREESKVSSSERLKNKTESDKIEDSARAILNSTKTLDELDELLGKDKNITGWMPALATKFHASKDENKAKILTKITDLQAAAAKAESSRPGIGMVNFYRDIKPSMWNDPAFNMGQTKALREKNENLLNGLKEDWERKNPGKKFPYSMAGKTRHSVWNPATGKLEQK